MGRVLVACEFSGVVRDAFIRAGHDAISCDLMETESPGRHYTGDVADLLDQEWDLMIAHPPCTYLANSGVRWLHSEPGRSVSMVQAAEFFLSLWHADHIPRVCLENPIQHGYAKFLIGVPYSQIVQPWQFGHGETKATCLWLRGLDRLRPTNVVDGRRARVHRASPGPSRWKDRSRTPAGIAAAMADQWLA